jgi:GTP cyclohydrolase IA
MKKIEVSWNEVFHRLSFFDKEGIAIYGIPKGGMITSGFLKKARNCYSPILADMFLDDVIDSGRTQEKFRKDFPDKPFVALYNKLEKDKDIGWLVFPWESEEEKSIEDSVVRQLQFIGENPTREGLIETPRRVIRSWKELYAGYNQDPESIFKTFVEGACDEMVLLRDVEFYSQCEHHMLCFFGKAHIAYIPDKKVIGVSKLARLLEIYSRRLQIQERIGQQVTDALMKYLKPKGAACVLEAQHFCMTSRGVQKQGSVMVTSSLKGDFLKNSSTRAEFMELIKQ